MEYKNESRGGVVKALSIKQPWAYLIVHGFTEYLPTGRFKQIKDIENRNWNTKYRGKFYIHASKNPDIDAIKKFVDRGLNPNDLVYGAIIGYAELVDVTTDSTSKWFEGPYGFVLRNANPIEPISIKGQLGFFNFNPTKPDSCQNLTQCADSKEK